jgi:hypothetical protein
MFPVPQQSHARMMLMTFASKPLDEMHPVNDYPFIYSTRGNVHRQRLAQMTVICGFRKLEQFPESKKAFTSLQEVGVAAKVNSTKRQAFYG